MKFQLFPIWPTLSPVYMANHCQGNKWSMIYGHTNRRDQHYSSLLLHYSSLSYSSIYSRYAGIYRHAGAPALLTTQMIYKYLRSKLLDLVGYGQKLRKRIICHIWEKRTLQTLKTNLAGVFSSVQEKSANKMKENQQNIERKKGLIGIWKLKLFLEIVNYCWGEGVILANCFVKWSPLHPHAHNTFTISTPHLAVCAFTLCKEK